MENDLEGKTRAEYRTEMMLLDVSQDSRRDVLMVESVVSPVRDGAREISYIRERDSLEPGEGPV
jgi:hypothetical protein